MDCPSIADEDISALLLRHDIKPTAQRVDIARLLLQKKMHLSAEDVYLLVNPERQQSSEPRQRVSKATVYNTLGLFAQKGLVREVIADPSKIFYDPNTAPHYHFYDTANGTLTDIDATAVKVSGLPPLPEGKEMAGIDVVVRLRSQT